MTKPEKEDQELEELHRQQTQGQQPGGRATRGPADDSVRHRTADELPNRGTGAPGQEQPAAQYRAKGSNYEGTGPSHVRGTSRGNERALGKDEEKLRKKREEASILPSTPGRSERSKEGNA
ncbi:MAG: hypothetical protein ACRDZO_10795 [Egibacteraceae bacterium]